MIVLKSWKIRIRSGLSLRVIILRKYFSRINSRFTVISLSFIATHTWCAVGTRIVRTAEVMNVCVTINGFHGCVMYAKYGIWYKYTEITDGINVHSFRRLQGLLSFLVDTQHVNTAYESVISEKAAL